MISQSHSQPHSHSARQLVFLVALILPSLAQAAYQWEVTFDQRKWRTAGEACVVGEAKARTDEYRRQNPALTFRYRSANATVFDEGDSRCRYVIERRVATIWVTHYPGDHLHIRTGSPDPCHVAGVSDPESGLCDKCPSGCCAPGGSAGNNGSNPIQSASGNKHQMEVDYEGAGAFPLSFRRYYNSNDRVEGSTLGVGWRHSFSRFLSVYQLDGQSFVQAYRPDGRILKYRFLAGQWQGDADIAEGLQQVGNIWQLTTVDGDEVETYDETGEQLLSITNRAGLVTTLSYADLGRLSTVRDPFGRQLTFTYDSRNRLATMRDSANREYIFEYDPSPTLNRLLTVIYPDATPDPSDNPRRRYHYENASFPYALTGITDENGDRYATWAYYPDGRAQSSEHAGSVDRYTLTYNGDGTTTVRDPRNTDRVYTFQAILGGARNASISQPCGSGCGSAATTYNTGNAFVESKTDWNGNKACYTHNARGLEELRIEGLGSASSCTAPTATPVSRKITTQWHPTFRLPTQMEEFFPITAATPIRRTTNQYDPAKGTLLSKTVTDVASGRSRTWTYTYNTRGQIETEDGPRTDVVDVTTYEYWPADDPDLGKRAQLRRVTNALGHETQYTQYDGNARVQQIIDPNGLVINLRYDERGRLLERDSADEVALFEPDGVGQVRKVTLPDGSFLRYRFDAAHRLDQIQDRLGNKITYTLNVMGGRDRDEVTDVSSNLVQLRSRVFNALNRLQRELGANPATEITEYDWDNNGNLQEKRVRLDGTTNLTTTFDYDQLNRMKERLEPDVGGRPRTQWDYTNLDQVRQITDPRNLATAYTINALDNTTEQISPDTGTLTRNPATGFDDAGNVRAETDAEGRLMQYTYDALNRRTQATYPGGITITYQYDQGLNGRGRLTGIIDPTGSTTYTYDPQGRVRSKTQVTAGRTFIAQYRYDAFGRMDQMTLPSGRVINYGFDVQRRVVTLDVDGTPLILMTGYHPFGAPNYLRFGNGVEVFRLHDLNGRINNFTRSTQSLALDYDPANRIIGLHNLDDPTEQQTFGYDNLDRLSNYLSPAQAQSMTYDANGNRRTQSIDTQNYTYSYPGTNNRLTSVDFPQPRNFSYDNTGNVNGDGTHSYTYDGRGRLIQADSTTYVINGLGQRVLKTGPGVPSGSNYFVYDEAGKLMGEYDAAGALLQEIVYVNDLPVTALRPGGPTTVYNIYADHLTTPRMVTNQANQPVWRWDSEPFGATAPNEDPSGLGPFKFNSRFPGQYYDSETGLSYNYFRDYDATIGRYVESDPIGLKGGLNTYAYVRDTPIGLSDAFGLWPCACRLQSSGYNNGTGKFECKYSCKCYCEAGGRNKDFGTVAKSQNIGEFNPRYRDEGPCQDIFLFDSSSNRLDVFDPFWYESFSWNSQMNDFCNCKPGSKCC